MTTFQRAFERLDVVQEARCTARWPSMVRFGLLIASLQAWDTGCVSDGISARRALRVLAGAVGARSGWPGVSGLSQTPFAEALALRNDRSSRKKSSRFLPQRTVR